jgi:hypothetical protein
VDNDFWNSMPPSDYGATRADIESRVGQLDIAELDKVVFDFATYMKKKGDTPRWFQVMIRFPYLKKIEDRPDTRWYKVLCLNYMLDWHYEMKAPRTYHKGHPLANAVLFLSAKGLVLNMDMDDQPAAA